LGGLKKCVIDAQEKKRITRPIKHIDWDIVDTFLISGSSGTELAGLFDMHQETFYVRFQKHHGVGFTGYCQQKRSKGDAYLRHQQYLKAIGKSTDGDNTLLIWLGKNRLNQKETPDQNADEERKMEFSAIMQQLSALQSDKINSSNQSSSESTFNKEEMISSNEM